MGKKFLSRFTFWLLTPLALTAVEKMVVLNSSSNSISIVETTNDTVIATLSPVLLPRQGVYDSVHHKCYVSANNGVVVIDTDLNQIINLISVGTNPIGIVAAPNLNKVYVAGATSGIFSVIDTDTDSVVATVPVGTGIQSLLYVPSVQKVYVANRESHSVSVINAIAPYNHIATIGIPTLASSAPDYLAASCDQTRVFVSDDAGTSNRITVIDTGPSNSILSTVAVGTAPRVLSIDCTNNIGLGVVANSASTNSPVKVINTNSNPPTVLAAPTIPVASSGFRYSAVLPSKNQYYVSSIVNGTVYIGSLVPPYQITTTLILGPSAVIAPSMIVFNSLGSKAYISNFNNGDQIFVLDTSAQSLLYPVTVGNQPIWIVPIPDHSTALPSPPINLSGNQFVNTYLTQQTRINQITWQPPASGATPVQYRIYRNATLTNLAAVVQADDSLCFTDRLVRNRATCYFIVTVDAEGNVSAPAVISVR